MHLDATQQFYRIRGDEPWNTFDKKNIGGTLIGVGWGITVITIFGAPPTKTNKFIAYGVGGSVTVSGLLYWIVKGSKYNKENKKLDKEEQKKLYSIL
jgi:hypothetical protein